MVFVHSDAVETDLVGELQLVHVRVVEAVGFLRVEQVGIDVHPDGPVRLPEVLREIGPGHEVEPNEFHDCSEGLRLFMF